MRVGEFTQRIQRIMDEGCFECLPGLSKYCDDLDAQGHNVCPVEIIADVAVGMGLEGMEGYKKPASARRKM